MISQRPRRTREFTGPTPSSVAIVSEFLQPHYVCLGSGMTLSYRTEKLLMEYCDGCFSKYWHQFNQLHYDYICLPDILKILSVC